MIRKPQGVSADDPPVAPAVVVAAMVLVGLILAVVMDYLIGG